MTRRSTGPFREGDSVQLTDPKGRMHTVVLQPGKAFHTHRGALAHDDLIGAPEGIVVKAQPSGTPYLALRPLLADFVLSMPRGAAVVYPKDAAQIVAMGDVFPGARVVEAGAGSGALTCSLLRAVGDGGRVVSYERRPEFAAVARRNVERFFGGPHPAWELRDGDVGDHPAEAGRPDRARHARALGGARRGRRGAGARRRAGRVRGHDDAAVPDRRGAARARRVHRAGGLGDAWSGPGTWSGWRSGRSTG